MHTHSEMRAYDTPSKFFSISDTFQFTMFYSAIFYRASTAYFYCFYL